MAQGIHNTAFRMITWSIRIEGFLDPKPVSYSIAGVLLGGAVALGLQQDGDIGGFVAKGANGVNQQCRQIGHGPLWNFVMDCVTRTAAKWS